MRRSPSAAWLVLAALVLSLFACAKEPVPQPRRVVDPSSVQGAAVTDAWDLAAVAYEHYGQGYDYRKAGLEPVLLVVRNKSGTTPRILIEETRSNSRQGMYLPYSVDEATKLVYNAESFTTSAGSAARTGTLTALLGAGLGALLGTIGGGDNIWEGALIGGSAAGLAGAAGGTVQTQADIKGNIYQELSRYAWTSDPIPPTFTKVGYLYFPGGLGIGSVNVTIRTGDRIETYTLPVTGAPLPR
jgi:hypothetical protein